MEQQTATADSVKLEIFVPAGALGALKVAADAHRQFEDKVNEARTFFDGGDALKLSSKAQGIFDQGKHAVDKASANLRGMITVAAVAKCNELIADSRLAAGVAELTAKADSEGNIKSEAHVESAKPVEPPPAQESAWQEQESDEEPEEESASDAWMMGDARQEDEGSDDPLPPSVSDHELPAEGIIHGAPPSLEAQAKEHHKSMLGFRANLYSATMDRLMISIEWIERNNATVQEVLGATIGVIGQLPKFLRDLATLYVGNDPGFKIALALIKRNPDMAEGRSMSWWHPERINGMAASTAADNSGSQGTDGAAQAEGDAAAAEPKKQRITNKVLFDAISEFLRAPDKKAGILSVLELFKKRSWSEESWQKLLSSAPGATEKYVSECLHACYDSTQPKVIFEMHVDDLARKVNELEDDAPLAAFWKALAYHRRDLEGKSGIPEEFRVPRPAPAAPEPEAAAQSEAPAGESKEAAPSAQALAADAPADTKFFWTAPDGIVYERDTVKAICEGTAPGIDRFSNREDVCAVLRDIISLHRKALEKYNDLDALSELAHKMPNTYFGNILKGALRAVAEAFDSRQARGAALRSLLKLTEDYNPPSDTQLWGDMYPSGVLEAFAKRASQWKMIYQPEGGEPVILYEGDTYTPQQVRVGTIEPHSDQSTIRAPLWELEWALKANADAAAADDLENAEDALLSPQYAGIERGPNDMSAEAELGMISSADAGVMTSGAGMPGTQV